MHGPASTEHRLRRLAAMGIDVYVRRATFVAATGTGDGEPGAEPEPGTDQDTTTEGGDAAAIDRFAEGVADPRSQAPAAEVPTGGLAGARALLAESAPAAGPEAEAAPPRSDGPEPPPSEAPAPAAREGATPRFRLLALRCGAGLLLVDEALLPEARASVLARLGDLLRAGLLVRGDVDARRAGARSMETQAFFWPQVEAPHVDQSLPRAVEALGAWVRRCTKDGEGFLILVGAATDADGAAEPLAALETLPVRRARVDAGFVTAPGADAHRAAWRALAVLAVGGEGP